jgi:hypothetical protein
MVGTVELPPVGEEVTIGEEDKKDKEEAKVGEIPWELLSTEEPSDATTVPAESKEEGKPSIPVTEPKQKIEEKKVGVAEVIDIETLKESKAESAKKEEKKSETSDEGYTYFGDQGGIPIEKIIEEVEKSF